MSAAFGFGAVGAAAEQRLVSALGLWPLPLPPELARLDGSWKGSPIALSARAYAGPRIGYARYVQIDVVPLEIVNLLALARPEFGVPVLGADLVGLGKDSAVVVADLSPVPGAPPEPLSAAALAQLRALELPFSELPGWCRPWFSTQALCTRVPATRAPAAAGALAVFTDRFVELLGLARDERARAGDVEDWQERYCAAHRRDDHGLSLLHRIFEPTLAERFLREVLFPERIIA